MGIYTYPKFAYTGPADLQVDAPQRRPLVIVGAGPVGLAAAIDARLKGLPVLVFDEDDTVSIGSRAVCYAKRALEVLDRLGVGDPICDKGVSWNVGRTFFREKEVYQFRPGARRRPQAPRHDQPAAVLPRRNHGGACGGTGRGHPLALQGGGCAERGRPCAPARGHARRHLRHRGRLADRGRRRAQPDPQHAGPGDRGPHLHGPLPDRRRDHEGRLPGRALVLVRPAVSPQPERAAAQAERQRLAHRLPARLGRRPRGREEAGKRHSPPQGHAGRRPSVRPGVGQHLHLPVPAHEGLPRRARACSWAMRRTRCRRSARAARTRVSRTPTT